MRLFGAERIQKMMDFVKFTDETPIEAGILSRSIENAQSKVENHNYEIRKQVLEYDDVMNKQREIIYGERRRVLQGEPMRDFMLQTLRTKVEFAVDSGAPPEEHPSEWDLDEILAEVELIFPVREHVTVEDLEKLDRDEMKEKLYGIGVAAYEAKEAEVSPEIMRMIESQYIMLPIIDRSWVDHLYVMDALKAGIGLRGYGQKDPRVEYEKEAYEIFEDLKNSIADEAIKSVFAVRIERTQDEPPGADGPPELLPEGGSYDALPAAEAHAPSTLPNLAFEPVPAGAMVPQAAAQPRLDPAAAERILGPAPRSGTAAMHENIGGGAAPARPKPAADNKVGRNDQCPCGSGKKYKRCHGAAA
jgi:preprotein translocase subunit SecA